GITAQGSDPIQNSLAAMFRNANAFDQDLSGWDQTLPQGLKDLTEPPIMIFVGAKLDANAQGIDATEQAARKRKWPASWR
ncbi:MAG: hypothetical protein AAF975_06350, partial [Spirochaetota bacterium]